MVYAVKADVVTIYGQRIVDLVADRDNDGRGDDPVITSAMESASAEMDTYLGQRYTLPLPSVPAILKQWCVDIGVYRMSPLDDARTEEMRKRYEDAIKTLKAIAAGDLGIGLPEDGGDGGVTPIEGDRPNAMIGSFQRA